MPPWLITALRLTGLGWYVAGCIVLGIIAGLWLGGITGQMALMTLLGTVLGSAIAFYGVYRMVLPAIYGSKGGGSSSLRGGEGRETDSGGNGQS